MGGYAMLMNILCASVLGILYKFRQEKKILCGIICVVIDTIRIIFQLPDILQAIPIIVTLVLLYTYVEELNRLALTDSLTGLGNRRKLEVYLKQDFNINTYLFMLDVDNLKNTNDQCGHLAGDDVLKKVAQILQEICVKTDGKAFRYGGDEFVMICELKTESQALELKKSILVALGSAKVSIGYAPYIETNIWIQKADEMLYEDKNALRE